MEIVSKRLFWELTLTIFVYLMSWLVVLKLGFWILGARIGLSRILPGALFGSFYSLLVKPFLPGLATYFILVALLVFFLKVYGKVRLIQAFWTAFLTLIIIYIGTILITSPLCSLDKNISSFFLKTWYGNIVGTFIETLFPGIVLFILSTLKVTMILPLGKKLIIVDFVGVYLFGALFYWIYNSIMRLLVSLKNNPEQILTNLVSEWIAAFSAVVGYYVVQTSIQKQREYERRMFETEKTELLNKIQELAGLNEQSNDNDCSPQELINSIGIIVNKLQGVSKIMNDRIKSNDPKDANVTRVYFSPREMKIIELIVQGKSNKEIAATLERSEGGIKNVITKILEKSGLEDRIQLAVYAVRNNLVAKK